MKKKIISEWTTLFHGVTHVKNLPKGFQITMHTCSSAVARAYMLHTYSDTPFVEVKSAYGKVGAVQSTCERWFNLINKE